MTAAGTENDRPAAAAAVFHAHLRSFEADARIASAGVGKTIASNTEDGVLTAATRSDPTQVIVPQTWQV